MRIKLLLALIMLGGVIACGDAPKKTAERRTLLTVDLPFAKGTVPDTIHLGLIKQGEIISGSFTLNNKGEKPLVIIDVKSGCGCTEAKFDTKPFMPSEEKVVDFNFYSEGRIGAQIKYFEVVLSDGNNATVYFDADIEGEF